MTVIVLLYAIIYNRDISSLVQQDPLPRGDKRMHTVLVPNKMTHDQALVIDKSYGDGLRFIEPEDRTGTALGGNIKSLTDITGGRESR